MSFRSKSVWVIFAIAASTVASAQIGVQLLFNMANCEAHSKQVGYLDSLDARLSKTVVIGQQDSALTPWVRQRFGLAGSPDLRFAYRPPQELHRQFGSSGLSVILVIDGPDTLMRFTLDELPGRTHELNALAAEQVEKDLIRCTRHPLLRNTSTPIGSDVQIAAAGPWMWLLDMFMGDLYRTRTDAPGGSELVRIGHVHDLIATVHTALTDSLGDLAQMVVRPDRIAYVDPITHDVVLLVNCTDTTALLPGTKAPYHRLLVTMGSEEVRSVVCLNTHLDRPDTVIPFFSGSGFTMVGDRMLSQVMKVNNDGNGHPLFALHECRSGVVMLDRVSPFDYRTSVWESIPRYQFVNGTFHADHFAFAIAPLVVDLRTWSIADLSTPLGISLDSAMAMTPGHWFTLDMNADGTGITLLCQAHGKFRLVQFNAASDGFEMMRSKVIDLEGAQISEGMLIDRNSFAFLTYDRDAIIVGSCTSPRE